MSDVCGDNRFEIIESYKRKLIESTNIETSPEEMAVIDNILFRFWQMGWLQSAQPVDKDINVLANEPRKGKWIRHDEVKNVYGGIYIECSECGEKYVVQYIEDEKYCRNCGADMREDEE